MKNPITSSPYILYSYIVGWMLFAIIQTWIVIWFFQFTFLQSLTDSLIENSIRGLTGLALWYPVRFNPFDGKKFSGYIINIVATGLLTVFTWSSTSFLILSKIWAGDKSYIDFLQESLPYRAINNILIFLVLILIYSLIIYSEKLKLKISEEANLKTLVREAELNILKAQINPHFLFNTLNSISFLIRRDTVKAREMLIGLSDFMRYSLKNNDGEMSSLGQELDNANRYIEIEKIRFDSRLVYEQNVEENLADWKVPGMILQPLLENAIKHGVYESSDPVIIHLSIRKSEEKLFISVENNFPEDKNNSSGEGIGLKNIRERLKIIYDGNANMEYCAKDGFFKVLLLIP